MNDLNGFELKSSTLCLSCGMCCQGILFYQQLDSRPFAISPEPRNPLFPSACHLFSFSQNKCLIYEDPRRPLICRNYQCHLVKRLQQNKLSFEQAQSKIDNIKTLLTKILVQIPQSDPTIPLYLPIQRISDALQQELESGDRSNLELFLDINWLMLLINRNFGYDYAQEHEIIYDSRQSKTN